MDRALIIDESPLFRKYFKYLFEKKGIKIDFGANCRDCIAIMRKIIPDFIILDIDTDRLGFMELLKQKKRMSIQRMFRLLYCRSI